ncbi:MAG: DUF3455 domain-containing protein [Xanthobacteraceae bacterium]
MSLLRCCAFASVLLLGAVAGAKADDAPLPEAIAAPGYTTIVKLHAEGAQIYECKPDAAGKLGWAFREPIATLMTEGQTVGRHYAGPNWDYQDGSGVTAKGAGNAPGATPKDIALLKLEVTSQRGSGMLSAAALVQRINTKGGKLDGACDKVAAIQSVPYSADYVFLRKP